jgi:transcriptional regulator with XRE-family HTH domain
LADGEGLGELRWSSEKKEHRLIAVRGKSKMEPLPLSNTISKLVQKLKDPAYRRAFVASQINIGIPFQIRAILRSRGWTQEALAERAGMLQPRISAMMKPGKTRVTIETLRRLAEAFDCALSVRFVPFSELIRDSEHFDPDQFVAPSFEQELGNGDLGSVHWDVTPPIRPISLPMQIPVPIEFAFGDATPAMSWHNISSTFTLQVFERTT